MKAIWEFIKSRVFLRNLIFAVLIGVVIVMITLFSLNIYTHHGERIPVPDLTGMSIEEVQEVLNKNKLRYNIVDSTFTDAVPKGTVYEQNPPVGFNVKRQRKIFITINAFNTEQVAMPNLVDASLIQAKSDIYANGLNIGYMKYIDHYAQNYVLKQKYNGKEIKPGKMIDKGAKIELVLGRGDEFSEEIEITVPNLYGLTLNQAYNRATDFFLNIGEIHYDGTVNETNQNIAVIYKTDPWMKFKTKELGMEIDVWLTTDKVMAKKEKIKTENAPPPKQPQDSTQTETENDLL